MDGRQKLNPLSGKSYNKYQQQTAQLQWQKVRISFPNSTPTFHFQPILYPYNSKRYLPHELLYYKRSQLLKLNIYPQLLPTIDPLVRPLNKRKQGSGRPSGACPQEARSLPPTHAPLFPRQLRLLSGATPQHYTQVLPGLVYTYSPLIQYTKTK